MPRTLGERIELCQWICYNAMFTFLLPRYIPVIMAGHASLAIIQRLASWLAGSDKDISPQLALHLTRSMPNNVTSEMDLELWRVAQAIRQDAAAPAALPAADAETVAQDFLMHKLPSSIQKTLANFLDRYGLRGLAEIDFGRPRWREQPVPNVRALQSYLSMSDGSETPDKVYRDGQLAAIQATERLATAATRISRTPLGGSIVRWLAKRVRALAGLREKPQVYRYPPDGHCARCAAQRRSGACRRRCAGTNRRPVFLAPARVEGVGNECAGRLEGTCPSAQNCGPPRTATPAHPPLASQ